jgi:hypothetical protein
LPSGQVTPFSAFSEQQEVEQEQPPLEPLVLVLLELELVLLADTPLEVPMEPIEPELPVGPADEVPEELDDGEPVPLPLEAAVFVAVAIWP